MNEKAGATPTRITADSGIGCRATNDTAPKNLKAQVAQLKQSVLISSRNPEAAEKEVDHAFGNLTADSASQISKQDRDIQEQIMKGMAGDSVSSDQTQSLPAMPTGNSFRLNIDWRRKKRHEDSRQMAADAMKASQTKVEKHWAKPAAL